MSGLPEEFIAILDLADELQVRKSRIFKLLKRLGVDSQLRRESKRGNQLVAYITVSQAALLRAEIARTASVESGSDESPTVNPVLPDEGGVFYLIQLEPQHDPGRFKVGFTTELGERLRKHRCSAPFAVCVQTWPCRRTWERAAIACVTQNAAQLHTEVFRVASLQDVRSRGDAFFSMMPSITAATEEQQPNPAQDGAA